MMTLFDKNPLLALLAQMHASGEKHSFAQLDIAPQGDVLLVEGLMEPSEAVLQWLEEKNRSLHFFEADLNRFESFPKEIIAHPHIFFYQSDEESLKQALWKNVLLPAHSVGSSEFRERVREYEAGIHLTFSDVADYGVQVWQNIVHNLQKPHIPLEALKGHFEGIPAIICGAGPSLEKQLPSLRNQRALIIACGSAIALLDKANIPFHLAAHFDPKPPQERIDGIRSVDKPLVFLGRVSKDVIDRFTGPLIYAGSHGGHPLEEYLLGRSRQFDGGWTVANFGARVAQVLGCSPITSIGVDLLDEKKDFFLSKKWFSQFAVDVKSRSLKTIEWKLPPPTVLKLPFAEIRESIERARKLIEQDSVVAEIELEDELVYRELLVPLWDLWQYVYERSGAPLPAMKRLFYRDVLHEYAST